MYINLPVSILWSNCSRFIIYGSSWDKEALLLSTQQHSRWTKVWKKTKNKIHNATRSPDLVGLYKTMRGAELQDHILKKKKVVYCPDKTTNRQQRQTMGKKNTLANAWLSIPMWPCWVITFVGRWLKNRGKRKGTWTNLRNCLFLTALDS